MRLIDQQNSKNQNCGNKCFESLLFSCTVFALHLGRNTWSKKEVLAGNWPHHVIKNPLRMVSCCWMKFTSSLTMKLTRPNFMSFRQSLLLEVKSEFVRFQLGLFHQKVLCFCFFAHGWGFVMDRVRRNLNWLRKPCQLAAVS